MPSPREIELKLDLDPGDVTDLRMRVLPALGAAAQGTTRLLSVYFDTDKQALRKHGISLRLRSDGGRIIQTVKADAGAGLFARDEWETEVDGQEPRLDAVAESPLGRILIGKRGPKRLRPVFETSIDRTLWLIETADVAIEVALDEGQIRAGGTVASVSEVELELKRGPAAALFDVARQLMAQVPAKLGVRSKAERGYGLLDDRQPRSFAAEPVLLSHDMTTAEAFQAILRNCMRQFRLNEPLLVAGRSVAALHQARVAMRRLRSALSLFAPVVADDRVTQLKVELGVVSGKLGEARNLDVYRARCGRYAAAGEAHALGAATLAGAIESRRAAAYADVIRTLDSAGFNQLMLDLAGWVEAGPWLTAAGNPLRDTPVAEFAAKTLERRRRKLRRKGRRLKSMSPQARHRVRIQAKKLRYAAEFFAGLVTSRKARRRHAAFLAAVQALQARLGALNDIETGLALATAVVRDLDHTPRAHPQALIFAAGHVSGRQAAGRKRLLRKSRQAFRAFAETPRFWRR